MSLAIIGDTRSAIYKMLTGDTILMSKLSGVFYGQAGTDQAVPYITIGEDVYVPWDCFKNPGWQITLTIDIWAALSGGDSYTAIVADCYRLFHHPETKVPLTQFKSVDIQCEWMTVLDDQVNDERHIPIRTKSLAQTY